MVLYAGEIFEIINELSGKHAVLMTILVLCA